MTEEELGKLKERIAELEQQIVEEREDFEWDLKAAKEGVTDTIKMLGEENAQIEQAASKTTGGEDTEMLTQRALMAESRVTELLKELEHAREQQPPPIPSQRDPLLQQRAEKAERERDEFLEQNRNLQRSLEEKESAAGDSEARGVEQAGLAEEVDGLKKELAGQAEQLSSSEAERDRLREELERARASQERHQRTLADMSMASDSIAAEAEALKARVAELEIRPASGESDALLAEGEITESSPAADESPEAEQAEEPPKVELEELEPVMEMPALAPEASMGDADVAFVVSPVERPPIESSAKPMPAEMAGATGIERVEEAEAKRTPEAVSPRRGVSKWLGVLGISSVVAVIIVLALHPSLDLFGGKSADQTDKTLEPGEPGKVIEETVPGTTPPEPGEDETAGRDEAEKPAAEVEKEGSGEPEPGEEKRIEEDKKAPAKEKPPATKVLSKKGTPAGKKTTEEKAPGEKKATAAKKKPGRKVVKVDKELGLMHMRKGNQLVKSGDFRRAVPEFIKALKANPYLAGAYRSLGISYAKLRQNKNACISYRRYMKMLPPDSPEIPTLKQITAGCK